MIVCALLDLVLLCCLSSIILGFEADGASVPIYMTENATCQVAPAPKRATWQPASVRKQQWQPQPQNDAQKQPQEKQQRRQQQQQPLPPSHDTEQMSLDVLLPKHAARAVDLELATEISPRFCAAQQQQQQQQSNQLLRPIVLPVSSFNDMCFGKKHNLTAVLLPTTYMYVYILDFTKQITGSRDLLTFIS